MKNQTKFPLFRRNQNQNQKRHHESSPAKRSALAAFAPALVALACEQMFSRFPEHPANRPKVASGRAAELGGAR